MTPGDIDLSNESGADGLRRHCILRLTEEAREQGGLLSQEDLVRLLHCDMRTIRRGSWCRNSGCWEV